MRGNTVNLDGRERAMAKEKTKWTCKECGYETGKYAGKCFGCNQFGTLEEERYFTGPETKSSKTITSQSKKRSVKLDEVSIEGGDDPTFSTGIAEFDRVLGHDGVTVGSLILLGGAPGLGKSTLLSSVCEHVSLNVGEVLYISGEESEKQMKKRMQGRMNIASHDRFRVLYTNDISTIEEEALRIAPHFLVVDSINTIGDRSVNGDPGDPSQIKHCTNRLMNIAKEHGITTIVVSQVTKDNEIAGPKKLEHMVDTVLFLEGEKYSDLRLLRVNKNRFGSDQELGVFQMREEGMVGISNPSEYLLANRPKNASGSSVVCVSDTRPLMIEVQALVSTPPTQNVPPRRVTEGFSRNRMNMLTAVLERKAGATDLSYKDIYVNVVGGLDVDHPGADLGVAMSIYSSNKDVIIPDGTVMIGEVGLAGEVRQVSKIEQLVREAEKVGFTTCLIPASSYERVRAVVSTINLKPVAHIREAVHTLFEK